MIKISRGIRVYTTSANRVRAIKLLRRRGYRYFTQFKDVQGYGLSYGNMDKEGIS